MIQRPSFQRMTAADVRAMCWLSKQPRAARWAGHTAAASVMATLICVFFPALAPMAALFALMVGASRVLLGVHYPTDILAGATLGISSTLSALWVLGSV